MSSYYVKRSSPTNPEGIGWVGPLRTLRAATREKAAWESCGHTASVHPSTPEIRREVRGWAKRNKERRAGSRS